MLPQPPHPGPHPGPMASHGLPKPCRGRLKFLCSERGAEAVSAVNRAAEVRRVAEGAGEAAKGVATKTDRLKAHVLNGELDAARREAAGQVVVRKPDGTPWNHVQELRDAQRGLQNRIDSIKSQLGREGISDAQRAALQNELGQASRLLDKTEGYLPR